MASMALAHSVPGTPSGHARNPIVGILAGINLGVRLRSLRGRECRCKKTPALANTLSVEENAGRPGAVGCWGPYRACR